MLDKTETIRQVLVNAIEHGLPGAATALRDLSDVNGALVEFRGIQFAAMQADIKVMHDQDVANGDCDG